MVSRVETQPVPAYTGTRPFACSMTCLLYTSVSTMLDFYFEPLRRRNAEHYAVGVYRFFSDAAAQEALRAALPPYPTFEFLQSRPVMTEMCIRDSGKSFGVLFRLLSRLCINLLVTC